LPLEQAAALVDVLDPHAQRKQRRLAAGAERAGLRHAHADLDRAALANGKPWQRGRRRERGADLQCIPSGCFHFALLLVALL
jgi:hypothetical protein